MRLTDAFENFDDIERFDLEARLFANFAADGIP